MIEESLLKSNFIGRDGFRWWIGQVAPFESNSGQLEQNNGGGWGNRVKVRIIGYHPFNEDDLSNDKLPFAHVMLPTTAGSGAAGFATPHRIRPADTVFGFFLDGDDGQQPIIMGCLGRTSEVGQESYSIPFQPFTGYSSQIAQPDGSVSVPDQTNETNTQTQKAPRILRDEIVQDLNKQVKDANKALPKNTPKFWQETSYYNGIGAEVTLGNSCQDTGIGGIISLVSNLVGAVSGTAGAFLNTALEVSKTVSAITSGLNGIVGNMFSTLSDFIKPLLQQGLGNLFNAVFSSTLAATFGNVALATLAGVTAQSAFLAPVKFLQDSLFCGIGNVLSQLGDLIEELLYDTIDNAVNFVTCAGYQFVGSLINTISFKIQDLISSPLGALTGILTGGLDILDVVTSGIDSVSKVASIFDCNQDDEKCSGMVEKVVVGQGVVDYIENTNAILKNARTSQKIGDIVVAVGEDVNERLQKKLKLDKKSKTGLKDCDTKRSNKLPKIKIFGGGTMKSGRGKDGDNSNGGKAEAIAVLGEFVQNFDGKITGSIVNVKITNRGKGYKYPPFVEIIDPSGVGYGAVARSIINPNTGELESIYMVSIGENYSIGDTTLDGTNIPITTPGGNIFNLDSAGADVAPLNTVGIGTDVNIGISSVLVVNSGIGYSGSEILLDENGRPYGDGTTFIGISTNDKGGIQEVITVQFDQNNNIIRSRNTPAIVIDGYPEIIVNSQTGSGAVLKPSIGIITSINQPLVQIIDCI